MGGDCVGWEKDWQNRDKNERQRPSRCGSEGVVWLARPSHLY